MLVNGVDLDGLLAEVAPEWKYPDVVPGRTAHIDADFLAYQVSYEKEDDNKTLDDMQHNAEVVVDHLKRMAGAENVHMHLTPSPSDKGGRYDQALQKPYQGNRTDKPKPRYLHIMRDWLSKKWQGTQHYHCEADDGMSSAQYAAIAAGDKNKSVIVTKDKDLRMVPGLHLDWATGQIRDFSGFGEVALNGKGKLMGFGTKWFWAQMLVGDSADNTQGLPLVPGMVMNKIKPTAATLKAQEVIKNFNVNGGDMRKMTDALEVLGKREPGKCGPATAVLMLNLMSTNRQALIAIESMYRMIGETVGYKDYRNGNHVDWLSVFKSEAQMHWMRINKDDPEDVLVWFNTIRNTE
jgi:hypothetical protein